MRPEARDQSYLWDIRIWLVARDDLPILLGHLDELLPPGSDLV